MTRDDVIALDAGDSVIGLGSRWDDELPVVHAGELHYDRAGQVSRPIHVQRGYGAHSAVVREGDRTIRAARRF